MCKITRMRNGELNADHRVRYASMHAVNITRRAYNGSQHGASMHVPTIRVDTLWTKHLRRRHIDFVKVDVDTAWMQLGIEGLLEQRAFTAMTIEVDQSFGGVGSPPMAIWSVSSLDQLVWLARAHGFSSFLKVPCRSNLTQGAQHNDMDSKWTAWYYPLANTTSAFIPTQYTVGRDEWPKIQDVVLIDESATVSPSRAVATTPVTLSAFLQRRAREECRKPYTAP